MIRIKNLNFTYPNSDNAALDDITLDVKSGECVCLTGVSGCGKSTLLMACSGLIPHYIKGEMSGDVLIDGASTQDIEIQKIAEKVGMVFQNPDTQIFSLSVKGEVAFGAENLLIPPADIYERLKWALSAVGMEGFEDRNPTELSYGQKQRITIASVLSIKPGILLIDEPLSLMDCSGKEKVLDIILDLKKRGITLIIGEHNLPFIRDACDRVMVMSGGRIIIDKPASEIDAGDIDIFNREGIRWGKTGVDTEEDEKPVEFKEHSDKGKIMDYNILNYKKNIKNIKNSAAIKFNRQSDRYQDKKIIEIKNLTYTYTGGVCALDNISFDIYEGEFLGIVGKNGTGKTTLLKSIMGLIKPDKGSVKTLGITPDPYHLFGKVGFLIQDPEYQLFEESVFDEVAFSLEKLKFPADEIKERVRWALEITGMEDFTKSDPLALSFGQKHRVAFASVLALKPAVVILDDLSKGLDFGNLKHIMEALKNMQENSSLTVIMCTHDHQVIKDYVERVVRIKRVGGS